MRRNAKELLETLIRNLTKDIDCLDEQIRNDRLEDPMTVLSLEAAQKQFIATREASVHAFNRIALLGR